MHDPAVPVSRIRFGPFELDPSTGELRKGPTRLKVPDQSIEILKALLENPGHLVTRENLRERLWPSNTFVDFEHGLNAAVRRLREALGADRPKFIETLPRRGYRFVGTIEGRSAIVSATSPPSVTRETASTSGVPAVASPEQPTPRALWAPTTHAASRRLLLISLVVLASGVVLWLGIGRGGRRVATSSVSAPLRSVAITSFPGVEADPALSPDGNQVAFAWDAEAWGHFDI
jgi:DNA-binding winged helix-turn-helix (wHTH) protein